MAVSRIEEFSFSSEDQLATSCSGALHKVKNLSEQAPLGRLFAAISTLKETTLAASEALEDGNLSLAGAEIRKYAGEVSVKTSPKVSARFK